MDSQNATELLRNLIVDEYKHAETSLNYVQSLLLNKKRKPKKNVCKPSKIFLSNNRKARMCLGLDIVNKKIAYDTAEKLHKVWNQQLEKNPNFMNTNSSESSNLGSSFKKLSLIGGKVIITSSKNKCLEGIKGIIVMETSKTFHIVAEKNGIKIVPKHGSIFSFLHESNCFQVYGSHLNVNPNEKITKKYKSSIPPGEIYF